MKSALIAFLVIHLLDLLVLPIFTAKCRYGTGMDKCRAWIPFQDIYKLFLLVELVLVYAVCQNAMFYLMVSMDFFFVVNWMSLCRAVMGKGEWQIGDPWTGTAFDLILLKEQRFYPEYPFSLRFYLDGLEINLYRYAADVAAILTLLEILHFL